MMHHHQSAAQSTSARRGHTLIIVMVLLTFSSVVMTAIVRSTLTQYQASERMETRLQADSLAESALTMALTKLQQGNEYSGETWNVSIPEFGEANVRLTVGSKARQRLVRVHVVLPVDAPVTSQVRIERTHNWHHATSPTNE